MPALLGHPVRFDDLRGRKRATTDHADLALAHEVAHGAERLVDVGQRVDSVDLVQVDVVGAEAAQRVFTGADDPRPGRAPAVEHVVAHGVMQLRRDDDLVATVADPGADDLLGLAVAVHVGSVDEVDAGFERTMHDAHAVVVVGVAVLPEHHRAEAQPADRDAGAAECRVLHVAPSPRTPNRSGPYRLSGTPQRSGRPADEDTESCHCEHL